MNPIQEAEFHLSIYHYFLWKTALEKAKENVNASNKEAAVVAAAPAEPDANAADDGDKKRPAKETNADSITTTTRTTNDDGDGINKAPAAETGEAETTTKGGTPPADAEQSIASTGTPKLAVASPQSQRYQALADAMLQQFPQHLARFPSQNSTMMSSTPPVVTTLYMDFPHLQSEVFLARNRVSQLESVNQVTQNENAKLKTDLAKAKRKDPPTATATGAAAAESARKRTRLSAEATELTEDTSISSRTDVPDGTQLSVAARFLNNGHSIFSIHRNDTNCAHTLLTQRLHASRVLFSTQISRNLWPSCAKMPTRKRATKRRRLQSSRPKSPSTHHKERLLRYHLIIRQSATRRLPNPGHLHHLHRGK